MGTLLSTHFKDILMKNSCFFLVAASYNMKKTNKNIKSSEEVKMIIVVDIWLQFKKKTEPYFEVRHFSTSHELKITLEIVAIVFSWNIIKKCNHSREISLCRFTTKNIIYSVKLPNLGGRMTWFWTSYSHIFGSCTTVFIFQLRSFYHQNMTSFDVPI